MDKSKAGVYERRSLSDYSDWEVCELLEKIMRLSNEELELPEDKIALAEKESNDLEKIESEKRRFEAIRWYTARPLYREPKTLWQRIIALLRSEASCFKQLFKEKDWCEKHQMHYQEHGFEGLKHCPECRREWYKKIR